MHIKKSFLLILHAVICMLFFLVPCINADNEIPLDISRALGVNIITKPGFYFISRTFESNLKIRSSDVVLELAGNTIEGGIDIGTNLQNITVQNGIIDGNNVLADAIKANAGSKQIVLKDLQIKNSTRGITFDAVSNGLIANCELTLNDTGADLTDSHNINFQNTIASRNKFTGFGMLRSTTCVFQECTALSTGHDNTQVLTNEVFGFVSVNGYGNIFERCIANATQALSTTDYNSLIAGFALRGTEQCTKIIDCESANATTSPDGVTVPYGILLQATFDGLVSVTSDLTPIDAISIDWSPDGKYLVVADRSKGIYVYQFDRSTQAITLIASDFTVTNALLANWSPDGNYLAVAGGSQGVYVYQFDHSTYMLAIVSNSTFDDAESVDWSPDGNYLAIAASGVAVYVYQFDQVTGVLTVKASDPLASAQSVNWSPDGNYLAVADGGGGIFVYQFDRGCWNNFSHSI